MKDNNYIFRTDGKIKDSAKLKQKQAIILRLHDQGLSYFDIAKKIYAGSIHHDFTPENIEKIMKEKTFEGNPTADARQATAFNAFIKNVVQAICEAEENEK